MAVCQQNGGIKTLRDEKSLNAVLTAFKLCLKNLFILPFAFDFFFFLKSLTDILSFDLSLGKGFEAFMKFFKGVFDIPFFKLCDFS